MKEFDFEKTAVRVSVVSIIGNAVLSAFKVLAGVIAHSGAMISDGVHSASDVFSSIIVIIGVKLSAKKSDKEHPYGHERMECVAAIILAVVLLVTGLFIGDSALGKLISGNYDSLEIPGILALIAAVISIIVKEGMFWYTRYYAKLLDSGAVMADAWHHRSDALSSTFVFCLFILKAAYDIFKDAVDKMVDHSCDDKTESQIRECVLAQEGIRGIDMMHTRIFGNKIYVDIEILVDGRKTLYEGHAIAEKVHSEIEGKFPKVKHIMVHVNPDNQEEVWKE